MRSPRSVSNLPLSLHVSGEVHGKSGVGSRVGDDDRINEPPRIEAILVLVIRVEDPQQCPIVPRAKVPQLHAHIVAEVVRERSGNELDTFRIPCRAKDVGFPVLAFGTTLSSARRRARVHGGGWPWADHAMNHVHLVRAQRRIVLWREHIPSKRHPRKQDVVVVRDRAGNTAGPQRAVRDLIVILGAVGGSEHDLVGHEAGPHHGAKGAKVGGVPQRVAVEVERRVDDPVRSFREVCRHPFVPRERIASEDLLLHSVPHFVRVLGKVAVVVEPLASGHGHI